MKGMTVKEKAAAIRSELKAKGIKGVSVTSAVHGCEECIRVKVKDPTVDIRPVEKVARFWSSGILTDNQTFPGTGHRRPAFWSSGILTDDQTASASRLEGEPFWSGGILTDNQTAMLTSKGTLEFWSNCILADNQAG